MKKIIKSLIKGFISYTIFCLWFFYFLLRKALCKVPFAKTPKAKTLRILANGPTLRDELEIAKFGDEYEYGMLNDSIMSPEFEKFRPCCYFLADPLYFTRDLEANDQKMVKLLNGISWQMSLYVPLSCVNYVKRLVNNEKVIIRPIPPSIPKSVQIQSLRNWAYRKGIACPPVQNVVVSGIYSAIMEGYKNIELYGVGHSWIEQLAVNEENVVCLKDVHYYNKDVELKPWEKCSGELYKLHEVLRDLAQMFDSYWELRSYADYVGEINIINKTKGSWIDAFERNNE